MTFVIYALLALIAYAASFVVVAVDNSALSLAYAFVFHVQAFGSAMRAWHAWRIWRDLRGK